MPQPAINPVLLQCRVPAPAPPEAPAKLPILPNERQAEVPAPPVAQPNPYQDRPCFACLQYGHFARDFSNRDGAKVYGQANQQVNQLIKAAQPADMPGHICSEAAVTTVTSTS